MNLDDRLFARIRKLLALADSQNPNEAAAAAARAAELMARHRIDAALLETERQGLEEVLLEQTAEKVTWRGILADGVARTLGCRVYWRHAPAGVRLHGIGTATDLAGTQYLYELLARETLTLADRIESANASTARDEAWRRDFLLSAAHTLRRRLREATERTRQAILDRRTEAKHALDRLDRREREAKAYLEQLHCARSGPVRYRSGDGRNAGRRAAESIDLAPDRPQLPGSNRAEPR